MTRDDHVVRQFLPAQRAHTRVRLRIAGRDAHDDELRGWTVLPDERGIGGPVEARVLEQVTEEHFDKTFNTNVRGLLFTVQKALPLLGRGSSVILTGSMVSIKGFAACSVYNASKAAIRSFARTWIVDLNGRDIRINVLSPGYTDTPGLAPFMTDDVKAEAAASVPLGRLAVPDDLGKAAVFLASDDSAYVTGIELFVDGGAAQI